MVMAGDSITVVSVPLCSKSSPEPGTASCHQSIYWLALSRLSMTCPAQRPTPLSELPTGSEGFPHNDHCPRREANNKMTVIIYFIIMLDYYDMKLVYYSLFPPDQFIRKEKAHNHSVYFSNEKIQVVPYDFRSDQAAKRRGLHHRPR